MSEIQGKVIRVLSPTELVINLGSSQSVTEHSRFVVFTLGGEIDDPDSGEPLGQLEIVKGRAEAKHVQEKMSTIQSIEKKKLKFDRALAPPLGSAWSFGPQQAERLTEEVEVAAAFQDVEVGDLVRVL